jgi:hypothetical protein
MDLVEFWTARQLEDIGMYGRRKTYLDEEM